jgi:hypothetical protein
LFSPQIFSKSLRHSKNKEMELERERERKEKVLRKKKRGRKELQKSLMKKG